MTRLYFVTLFGAAPVFVAWGLLDAVRTYWRFERWRAHIWAA
jgi:hypothetical protein